jgi:2-oxoglutarate dehydrogenase E1 component
VVVAPKKLLRFKEAGSDIEEFGKGLRFKRVIADSNPNLVAPEKVKRVIFCSGQVYYDLDAARKKNGRNDVAICRLEQFCPFPFRYVTKELSKYTNAELMWVQEEPKN